LDVKLYPATVQGKNGIEALMNLLKGFVKLGGFFMQPDVIDAEVLRQAQEHPEDFKTLSVRVSGWNARFVTLNEEWQNMIIERTAQGV
jgi:pyruvate-formate lyase